MYIINGVGYMPQITVYIKKEDMPSWKAIKNKAEWIRYYLNGGKHEEKTLRTKSVDTTESIRPVIKHTVVNIEDAPIKNISDGKAVSVKRTIDLTTVLTRKKIKTCEHGAAIGLCKFNCRRAV